MPTSTLDRPDADEDVKPDHPDDLDMSPDQRAEEAADLEKQFAESPDEEDDDDDTAAKNEQAKLDDQAADDSPQPQKKPNKGSMVKKGGMITAPILAVVAAFILLFFLSSLKALHFSTVLRSVGFASSQYMISEAFSEGAYTTWALENETGVLPDSTMLEKLRGQDLRDLQRKLVDKGILGTDSTGQLSRNQIAQGFEKDNWSELNWREKLAGRKFAKEATKADIAEVTDMRVKSYRNVFWKGIREFFGIKMTRWRTIFRNEFGNGSIDEAQNTDEARLGNEAKEVDGTGTEVVTSENPQTEEAIEEVRSGVKEGANKGIRLQARDSLDNYMRSKGSSLEGLQAGMAKVSAAVMVTTIYCIGHDLAHASDRINEQTEIQLANYGHQRQTQTDQGYIAGDATSADQKFMNSELNGNAKTPEAASAPLYREATGVVLPANTQVGNIPRSNMALPLLDWLRPVDEAIRTGISLGGNKLPLVGKTIDDRVNESIDQSCGVVLNPGVQGTVMVTELALGAFTAESWEAVVQGFVKSAAVFAGFAEVGHLIEQYIQQMSGMAITATETGADAWNAGYEGTDYLNSQTSRGTTFGRPETTQEATATKSAAVSAMREQYQSQGFRERYFAMDNPMSLLGLSVAKIPGTTAGMFSKISSASTILAQPFRMVGSMISWSKVSATPQNNIAAYNDYFGVNQWGWTPQEVATMRDTNMLENAAAVEAAVRQNPNYYTTLAQCYTPNKYLYQLARDDNCSRDKLSAPQALQWRIYKLHEFAINQLASPGLYEK